MFPYGARLNDYTMHARNTMHAFENKMQQNIQYCLHVNILFTNTIETIRWILLC